MLILVITYSVAVAVRRHLTDVECPRVVQMIEDGWLRRVAAAFGVSHSVVSRVAQRHREPGSYRRRSGGGRPRSTDGRDDRHLRLLVNRNQQAQSARRLQRGFQDATGIRLSTQTIRNRLHEVRMNARSVNELLHTCTMLRTHSPTLIVFVSKDTKQIFCMFFLLKS